MDKFRLSFSTLGLLNSCERKLQIEKLLVSGDREESEHLSFGTAYGAGVAEYLISQDMDQAIYALFMAYTPLIESEKKNLERCILALLSSQVQLDTLLGEYELVSFEGKPAIEMSFKLDIDDDYYYVGYLDAVLRNRYTGVYMVFECKTTGLLLKNLEPLYKHSGQALGYSVILDRVVGSSLASYGVLYFVCQLGKDFREVAIHVMPFKKTLLDRLNWFIVLGLDVQRLHAMKGLQIYPRRHTACLTYNKPCRHFGTCHLHGLDRPAIQEPDLVEYQFCYDLEAIVEDHLKRIAEAPPEPEPVPEAPSDIAELNDFSFSNVIDLDSMDLDALVEASAEKAKDVPVQPTQVSQPAAEAVSQLSPKEKLAAIIAARKGASK